MLRLTTHDKLSILALVRRLIPLLETEPLNGRLWAVDEAALRIRGEPA